MMRIIFNRFYFVLLSTLIVLTDQIAKHVITINYKSYMNKNFVIFSLDYVKNFGAAFNLFSGNRIFLSIVSIITSILLIYCILNNKKLSNIDLLSFSFVLGGTLGNGIDRIIKGYVIDYINLNFIDFPIFNISDLSINIGLILIIYSFVKYKK